MLDRNDIIEHRSFIEKHGEKEYKYKCEFLVGKFESTDFKIKLCDRRLIIEALHETPVTKTSKQFDLENFYYENDENDTLRYLGKHIERFVRDLDMPNFVDLDSLSCYLETYQDFQNVLIIEGIVERSHIVSTDESSTASTLAAPKNQVTYRSAKKDLPIDSSSMSSSKIFASNQKLQNASNRVTSDTFLKYKFDLSNFESKDIEITIRDRTLLNVTAERTLIDEGTGQLTKEYFNHDIQLPSNAEIYNIKNCFDENDGMLRIEIPINSTILANTSPKANVETASSLSLSKSKISASTSNPQAAMNIFKDSENEKSQKITVSTNATTLTNENIHNESSDKYLELVFDLYDFKFDRIDVNEGYDKGEKNKKVLVVRAYKTEGSAYKPYNRKYILPEWVDTKRIVVSQNKQFVDGLVKNALVIQIAIF